MPEQYVVVNYAESVPDDFQFTIKLPNALTLTHYYGGRKINPHFLSPVLFNEFLKTITPLQKKIGILMFQFEYMNKSKMSGLSELAERFEMFLSKIESPFPME